MDIESLKETLGDEKFAELKAHVDTLEGKLSTIRKKADSETARAAKLHDAQEKLMEKLGLTTPDEIDTLPDARGQAEAVKQYEAKLKKMERDLATASAEREEVAGKYKSTLQRAAVSEALAAHEFVARDLVETFVGNRLAWDGDELMFKADDGKIIGLKDGVASLAKSRPELLKSTGTGGAGVRTGAGGHGQSKTMTSEQFQSLTPMQRMEAAKSGVQIAS
jgi:hypothetical protein